MNKLQVKMILKNGKEVNFECDQFTTKTNEKTGELEDWSASNVSRTVSDGIPVYVRTEDISAISVRDYNDYTREEPTIKPNEVENNEQV